MRSFSDVNRRERGCARSYLLGKMLYVLALVKLPSVDGYDAHMVYWAEKALRGNCKHIHVCIFSQARVVLFVGTLWKKWEGPATAHPPFLVTFFRPSRMFETLRLVKDHLAFLLQLFLPIAALILSSTVLA